jgi:hypothetical protein
MTLEEAKKILERHGRSTCSCKYGGVSENMIIEAKRIVEEQEKNG